MLDLKSSGVPEGTSTHLAGRFSPHPTVWTAFAFGYLALGVLSFFASVFAYSQWSLGSTPSALWALGSFALIAVAMWWSAQVGQRLARGQMIELRLLLEAACLGRPAELSR